MGTVRVAICQIFVLDGDRSGNFVRIENAIREATGAGADILCFPEAVVLGWVNRDAHERAKSIPGEDSGRFCELALKYEIYLCAGLAENDGDSLYDSAVLIDDKGQILLKHRKINLLTELMSPPYTAGKKVRVVETKFGKIGILICADTHKDEILERMSGLEPDLVLIPYGYAAEQTEWPGHGEELARVVGNASGKMRAAVVGTNSVGQIAKGPWKGRTYGGQSVAADKNGVIIAVGKDRDRDIRIVAIETARPSAD